MKIDRRSFLKSCAVAGGGLCLGGCRLDARRAKTGSAAQLPRLMGNRDLHDALQMVSDMVGNGYRPGSVVAGYLAAENLRYLAQEENIHVTQGNIWSAYI